jgi:acetyltransferase
MSTRNLDALMAPASIAMIGASAEPGTVGFVTTRNLVGAGFQGRLDLVNPHTRAILGHSVHASVAALPEGPDLAVIATPPASVPALISELGARGCRAAIVITAGGAELRTQILNAAQPFLMRVVGPNCLGVLSPGSGVNASFAHLNARNGGIAFLTQSGAIATSMLDWAHARGVGFSHILSLGDMSDVDFGDLLDFLALDSATKSILLYVENVTHARKFMSAARIAARAKPVLAVKAGRGAAGAAAAASHTGALAGADIVYDAAFQRAGMLRVDSLRDLFGAAETLASGFRPRGARLTIVTNGGGLGVIAADALEQQGGILAPLSSPLRTALDAALPATWSHNNPIDILGDAGGQRYRAALAAAAEHGDQDAVLVMNCPTGVSDSAANAEAVLAAPAHSPLLACWMGEAPAAASRQLLSRAKIPNYETPEEAVRAFMQLVHFAANQETLLETPAARPAYADAARAGAKRVIERALDGGRRLLTEPEAKTVLGAYGIPVVATAIASDPEDAARAAAAIAAPIALKILSRDITHKSDVGGVALNLGNPDAVREAATQMLARVRGARGDAVIDGFTVQAMVRRPDAHELIIGIGQDRTFGSTLLFGQGGVAVEIMADRAMGLPPLNSSLARAMIARTRIAKLLAGYRNKAPANIDAIVEALLCVSDIAIELPHVGELDINPLLADADGVIALDARIVVRDPVGALETAIRPYPRELEREIALDDGRTLALRPIRPEDATALKAMAEHTAPEDLRLRFHGAVRTLDLASAARLSQIDYDREIAFVAFEPDGAAAGVGRIVFDPGFDKGEYALIVRSDVQGHGLGRLIMGALIEHARSRGAGALWGDVLSENRNMLTLTAAMGAKHARLDAAPELTRTTFKLDG